MSGPRVLNPYTTPIPPLLDSESYNRLIRRSSPGSPLYKPSLSDIAKYDVESSKYESSKDSNIASYTKAVLFGLELLQLSNPSFLPDLLKKMQGDCADRGIAELVE